MPLRIFLAFFLLFAGVAHAEDDWSLARDRDGIKVWTRAVPNHLVHAFKAVTVVKSSLGGLVSLILDTDHANQWVYRMDRIEVLKRDDAKATFVIRAETDFPWPLSNRDVVMEGQITQDEKTGVVNIHSHALPESTYPPNPDFVRMVDMDGDWFFRPLGNGLVEITMLGRADPAGHIPASMVNLLIHETPYRTMQGLRRVISDPRYQQASLAQIREP